MHKAIKLLSLCTLMILLTDTFVNAQLINYERRNRYLREAKGNPVGEDEELPKWMKEITPVTNNYEGRYDVNRDGKLQTFELKLYFRNVIAIIEEKGGFTINSDVLKEYDQNRDGVISRFELEKLKEDVEKI